jgi:hypothetical protein
MHDRTTPLEVLEVPEPCPINWEALPGDNRTRFCSRCGLNVHNLSAMPRDEAAQLVEARSGPLCVRFARAADGRVKTLDYSDERPPDLRRRRLIVSVASLGGLAVAVMNLLIVGRRPFVAPTVMGEAFPYVPPSTAPTTAPSGGTTNPAAPVEDDSPLPAET